MKIRLEIPFNHPAAEKVWSIYGKKPHANHGQILTWTAQRFFHQAMTTMMDEYENAVMGTDPNLLSSQKVPSMPKMNFLENKTRCSKAVVKSKRQKDKVPFYKGLQDYRI